MRVLLVEDHCDTRSVLGVLLNRCGCQTVAAKNVHEALARVRDMQFDVLLTDLQLPDGDGLDLVRQVKQEHALRAIAITGRTSDEDRARGMQAGFDYYLTKPIDFQQLRDALGLQRSARKRG